MNILTFVPLHDFQDFRNYRYTLPMVPGLMVDLEAQKTCVKIPTTGYNEAKQKPFSCSQLNRVYLLPFIGSCFISFCF